MVKNAKRLCYYEILGLNPNCSMDDVRHAYHELSKIYHPDKYNSSCGMSKDEASVKFLQIKYAYDILKEPDERAFYDSYLRTYAALEAFNPDLETVFVEASTSMATPTPAKASTRFTPTCSTESTPTSALFKKGTTCRGVLFTNPRAWEIWRARILRLFSFITTGSTLVP